jgi:hypothetical protein
MKYERIIENKYKPDIPDDLIKEAIELERITKFPEIGIPTDGYPYSTPAARERIDKFISKILPYLGGMNKIREKLKKIKRKTNKLADPDCYNWVLWATFLEIGIDCDKP